MNLEKLFAQQQILKDRIGYNGEDRFEKLVLALLVELGECANEWRGFKFWSRDREPRTFDFIACDNCKGKGRGGKKDIKEYTDSSNIVCADCFGWGDILTDKNPLLEEYVDGLHFVLELGLEYELSDFKYEVFICDSIQKQFIYLYRSATEVFAQDRLDLSIHRYRNLIQLYLGLGEMLGFTWGQIEQGYMDKNAVNHERQNNGY